MPHPALGPAAEGATGGGGNSQPFVDVMLRWMACTGRGRRRTVGGSVERSEGGGHGRRKGAAAGVVSVLDVVKEAGRWEVVKELADGVERRKVS